ncbi:protein NLRC3-like, partial [Tachysurus ichikawai]
MSLEPDSVFGDWVSEAPAFDCHPHCPGPLRFLLQVVGPQEIGPTPVFQAEPSRQPGNQALAFDPQPRAWLQGGAPVAPYRAMSWTLF